jgi:hypothetical protein
VLHPALDCDGESVRWSAVPAKTGRAGHPMIQWQSISSPGAESGTGRSASGGMPWEAFEPLVGELEPQTLAASCRILARHTEAALDCLFSLWKGWGWIPGGRSTSTRPSWR